MDDATSSAGADDRSVTPSADEGGRGGSGWRRTVAVFRVAVALVAVDYLAKRHRWFQLVAVPLSLVTLWWDWRVGTFVVAVALIVFAAYRTVVWLIDRLVLPRRVRRALVGSKEQVRAELDRMDLPTGPLSGPLFAWRLLRGKRPHAALLARMNEGVDRLTPLVSQSLTDLDTL